MKGTLGDGKEEEIRYVILRGKAGDSEEPPRLGRNHRDGSQLKNANEHVLRVIAEAINRRLKETGQPVKRSA